MRRNIQVTPLLLSMALSLTSLIVGTAAAAVSPTKPSSPASEPTSAATANPATNEDPVSIIRHKDQELQKLLRDKNASQKTGQLKILINGIFDFEELGKRALGNKTWLTLSPDQQKRFVVAFKGMVETSSVKKLEVYQSDSTRYENPEIDGDHTNVTAHVFNKGQESIVVYKLLQKAGTWKAWDLVIDDLSTSANYGEQFRKILQTGTIDGLIAKLEKKAAGEESKADNVKSATEKKSTAKPKPKSKP